MQTVIFDTNLLLDFFVFRDKTTAPLWEAACAGQFRTVTTQEAIDEFRDVLTRPAFNLTQKAQEEALKDFLSVAENVAVTTEAQARCRDPLDQKFIDLAVSEAPAVLITKDKLVLRCAKRIKKTGSVICSPSTALLNPDLVKTPQPSPLSDSVQR
ncbi:putative toxin-antitoxin system toxin component, PIN family [uncultured Parasutterella sp.]|uniref:putative toxin-antitoxin system toxin component, PIN family n=1 Tax=uncultured Parasutterella sp. TaxID=1263098 RepID=UPI002591C8F9|nr:putative toxin-antitoxin system toxin component, PIN family [uncultured Parasutterella sp.]